MKLTRAGNIFERVAKRIGWGLYASHIGPNGSYMRRWILRTPWFMVRLHHILRSDRDRHLHDHPFDFVSLLLSGGYEETTPAIMGTSTTYWPRFSVIRKRAEDLHRLTLQKPVWTLVFGGPVRREWGFQTVNGWVHHKQYLETWPEDGA